MKKVLILLAAIIAGANLYAGETATGTVKKNEIALSVGLPSTFTIGVSKKF